MFFRGFPPRATSLESSRAPCDIDHFDLPPFTLLSAGNATRQKELLYLDYVNCRLICMFSTSIRVSVSVSIHISCVWLLLGGRRDIIVTTWKNVFR